MFKPIPVAWRTWRPLILNYFDDHRITNAFTESFNAKIREVYRGGRGYTFEKLRAKVLFSDTLQKRVPIQEKVKTKKKQRFEEVAMARYMCLMGSFDDDFETVVKTRVPPWFEATGPVFPRRRQCALALDSGVEPLFPG